MKVFFYLLTAIITISCTGQTPKEIIDGKMYFGAKIDTISAMDITESLVDMTEGEERTVKIKGTIESVCQAKGCWMNIIDNSDDSVFIKFKDYAFFVPKDASGKKVIVEGVLSKTITSIDELRHYAEDEGASAEEIAAITKPKLELKMMADGVIIFE